MDPGFGAAPHSVFQVWTSRLVLGHRHEAMSGTNSESASRAEYFVLCHLPLSIPSELQLTSLAPAQTNVPQTIPGELSRCRHRFPYSPEFPRHYFHPEIQRCDGTECVPRGFNLQAGTEAACGGMSWGKRRNQQQERPSAPLPFAFMPLQSIDPIARG